LNWGSVLLVTYEKYLFTKVENHDFATAGTVRRGEGGEGEGEGREGREEGEEGRGIECFFCFLLLLFFPPPLLMFIYYMPKQSIKCPNGTRRNTKTKKCEKICPKYSKVNIKTGNCEKIPNSNQSFSSFRKTMNQSKQFSLDHILGKYSKIKQLEPQIHYLMVETSNDKIETLKKYADLSYYNINNYLRTNKISDLTQVTKKDIINIDHIFNEIPPISKPLKVFRGVIEYNNIFQDQYLKSDITSPVQNLQYLSTSLLYSVAKSFTDDLSRDHIFEIHIPANSKVIPLFINFNYDTIKSECEILLDRRGSLERIKSPPSKENITAVFKYIPPDYNNILEFNVTVPIVPKYTIFHIFKMLTSLFIKNNEQR
jgi:hypothetical protein